MNHPTNFCQTLPWVVLLIFKVKTKEEGKRSEREILAYILDEKAVMKDMTQQIKILQSYHAKLSPREMAYYLGIPNNGRNRSTELAIIQLQGLRLTPLFDWFSLYFCFILWCIFLVVSLLI